MPRTFLTDRLAALSDGVFAVAITLLVLNIGLPDPPEPGERLLHELGDNAPDFAGWLVSFVVLARFWAIHHEVTANLGRCHSRTILLNFCFLGLISLVPFASDLIGVYGFDVPLAYVFFSANMGLAALVLGAFAHHAASEPHLLRADANDLSWHWRHHVTVVPVVATVAAGMAFIEPVVSLALWTCEAVFVTIVSLRDEPAATGG